MADYIEREALREEIKIAQEGLESDNDIVWEMNKKYFAGLAWAHRLVLDAPAADVASVVHGRWIQEYRIDEMHYSTDDIERYKVPDGFSCSICSKWNSAKTNYCPNCGARMDGE